MYGGSPKNRRAPSFGFTAHPENAIEGTKDSNVELTESPLTEKAKQEADPSAVKLRLPINKVEDDAFANVHEWAKNNEKRRSSRKKPLSL